jgi:hypothetical protein
VPLGAAPSAVAMVEHRAVGHADHPIAVARRCASWHDAAVPSGAADPFTVRAPLPPVFKQLHPGDAVGIWVAGRR